MCFSIAAKHRPLLLRPNFLIINIRETYTGVTERAQNKTHCCNARFAYAPRLIESEPLIHFFTHLKFGEI